MLGSANSFFEMLALGLDKLAEDLKTMAEKHTKASVTYSKGLPQAHCGICKYFLAADSILGHSECKLVAGEIEPDMWCKLFERANQSKEY